MDYDWNFSVFAPYAVAFLRGAWVALALALVSSVLGSFLGIPLGVLLSLRQTSWALLSLNDALRAIPILVLMLFFYAFPYKAVFGITPLSGFTAAVLAMTLSQMVFTADLVRGAAAGVSKQTVLGARAIGLREPAIWQHIILPDVIRQIIPPVFAFFIANIKSSSLASAIGVHELVFNARVATGSTARNLEAWIIVAAIYIVLVVPMGWVGRGIEKIPWLKRRS